MTSKKDISSTEKLLDVIRGSGPSPEPGKVSAQKGTGEYHRKAPVVPRKLTGEHSVIGIDIGYNELRLVKVSRDGENRRKLLDYTRFPFEEGMNVDSPRFAAFLRESLREFCGRESNPELWALMLAGEVEVQHVRVPKMARKKVEEAVYFLAKKNVPFDDRNVIFDYGVQSEVMESGVAKLAVVAYTAPREGVKKITDVFQRAGFPLTGLTIAPFAIQNIFKTNWIPSSGKNIVTLYIGRDWSRIDIYNNGNFVMTRGIKTGINSMIESLMDEYNSKIRRVQIGVVEEGRQAEMSREYEKIAMSMDDAKGILYSLSRGTDAANDLMQRYSLSEREAFDLIQPALERLVRQIERTFEHFINTFGADRIDIIYVSSAMGVYTPLVEYIGDQLRIDHDILDPMNPELPAVNKLTSGLNLSERVDFLPALGLALSDNSYTLNHLYTYKDKVKERIASMAGAAIAAAFAVIMIVGIGYFLWLGHMANTKELEIARLQKQLTSDVQVDEKIIADMVKKVQQEQKMMLEYKNRYLGMSVISELAELTPPGIKLLSANQDLKPAAQPDGKAAPRNVKLEGLVFGDNALLESSLTGYVIKLDQSPIFSKPVILTQAQEPLEGKTVLRFVVQAEM